MPYNRLIAALSTALFIAFSATAAPHYHASVFGSCAREAALLRNMPYDLLNTLAADRRAEAVTARLHLLSITEQSLVLLHNTRQLIPYKGLGNRHFLVLQIGTETAPAFMTAFAQYAPYKTAILLPKPSTEELRKVLIQQGAGVNSLVLCLNNLQIDEKLVAGINILAQSNEIAVVNFGDAENIGNFDPKITILQANNLEPIAQDYAAQILFGGIAAAGKLPQNVGKIRAQAGETTVPTRLKYTIPEEVGIDGSRLAQIDGIAQQAIAQHVFPGCQVLVAKSGKVIYQKTFGAHEYDGLQTVQRTDLYDIASVTKCAATTLAVMRLIDDGRLRLEGQLGEYLPNLPNSTLRNITIREFLTHTSGLPATMPITPFVRNIAAYSAPVSPYKIAENLYIQPQYIDGLWSQLHSTPIYGRGAFKYSDANFNVLAQIVQAVSQQPLDVFCESKLYQPLGLQHILFNPLQQYSAGNIAPTEQDNLFRHQLLRGYVHDESAAILGGVGGNAGLFADANDLAVVFQLLLNGGSYGGEQLLSAATVHDFVATTTAHHRGLGFEKQSAKTVGLGRLASLQTFGHTGYTGTCAWADPQQELVYIFLSNRVYPSRSNLINRLDIRERIHDAVYQSLNTFKN